MDKDSFWNLVENSRKGAKDVDGQLVKLLALVHKLDPQEILEFDRCFNECVRDAFRGDLWAAAYIIKGGCSDDGFDYFLGWLIAQGRKYYEAALANPERAGDRVKLGEEVECEGIWSIAARAYEDKTGKTDFYDKVPMINRTLIGELFEEDTVNAFSRNLLKNSVVSIASTLTHLSACGAETNLNAAGASLSMCQIGSTPAGSGSALTKMRNGAALK